MTDDEEWVPRPGERVKLNESARGKKFESGVDMRRRWTVIGLRFYAGWKQPDVEMLGGEVINTAWLTPAEPREQEVPG